MGHAIQLARAIETHDELPLRGLGDPERELMYERFVGAYRAHDMIVSWKSIDFSRSRAFQFSRPFRGELAWILYFASEKRNGTGRAGATGIAFEKRSEQDATEQVAIDAPDAVRVFAQTAETPRRHWGSRRAEDDAPAARLRMYIGPAVPTASPRPGTDRHTRLVLKRTKLKPPRLSAIIACPVWL